MSRRRALLLVALAAAMAGYSALHLRVGTDISRFLPTSGSSGLAALSTQLADSPLTRTVVLSIGADETAVAVAAARELALALRGHPEIAWLRSDLGEADLEKLYELYFPRRLYFLSGDPERELPLRLAEPALRERARVLRERLAGPASGFLEALVSADPLGAFERLAQGFRGGQPALRVVDGQLVTPDGRFAILLLRTRGRAFDSQVQGRLIADLRESFAAIASRQGHALELELSAVGAFAAEAERSIKADVFAIALCSASGVTLLFIVFVASLRGFLVVSLPPLAGMLVATTLSLLVFGELDGLTMAFGTSLMGIAIDYSNHLLLHHGLARHAETPERTAARLRPSLVLAALTTVASFVGLGITPFPAFQQMAFFAVTGVLAGLAATLWVLPALLTLVPALPLRAGRSARRLDLLFRRVEALPRGVLLLPLAFGALSAAAIPAVRWSDDLSQLTRFDPALVAEDARVRERVAQLDTGRFVVAVAEDDESALRKNDAIHARLEALVAAGALDGTRSLHALLWSEELQRRNREALDAMAGLYPRLDAAFSAEGFRPGSLRKFAETLDAEPPPPLRRADLEASPLADLLTPFVFDVEGRVAVVTYLRGLRDLDAVRDALADLEEVQVFDQRSFVHGVYSEFRRTSLRQIALGSALVLLLLAFRYRAWRPVVAAFLPPVLVAPIVLALLAWLGESANLLHVMSLTMVMGMGVDYGIFCVDSVGRREDFGATLLSLVLSCLTTALVFGSLALSEQPSLRSIGLTTGVGILLSLLMAPVALAALGLGAPGRERRG
jgi:predicted exporter